MVCLDGCVTTYNRVIFDCVPSHRKHITEMTKLICRSVERFSFVFGIVAILILSGCAVIPPAVSITSFVIDGISYAISGKSTTDHLISGITEKDCALHRGLTEEKICQPVTLDTLPTPTNTVAADSNSTNPENAEQTMARLLGEFKAQN